VNLVVFESLGRLAAVVDDDRRHHWVALIGDEKMVNLGTHEVRSQVTREPCDTLVGPCMRDGRRNRTMMRTRQRRVAYSASGQSARRTGGTQLYARADDLVWICRTNAPSFNAPNIAVYAVLGFKCKNFKAGQECVVGTHQLLVVSRSCTSELCDLPPFLLECPAFP
jgi:hypothetical protein